MGAALVAGQGVHLVDDDGVDAGQDGPRRGRGQQEIERLRGRDEKVRRRPAHRRTFGGRGVAGPDGHREVRGLHAEALGLLGDAGQGQLQVLVDVDRQGAERRDVDDTGSRPGEGAPAWAGAAPVGGVDRHQEAGQGLAGAGRRGHQDVSTLLDPRPRRALGQGRAGREPPVEPLGHGGVERPQDGVGGQAGQEPGRAGGGAGRGCSCGCASARSIGRVEATCPVHPRGVTARLRPSVAAWKPAPAGRPLFPVRHRRPGQGRHHPTPSPPAPTRTP